MNLLKNVVIAFFIVFIFIIFITNYNTIKQSQSKNKLLKKVLLVQIVIFIALLIIIYIFKVANEIKYLATYDNTTEQTINETYEKMATEPNVYKDILSTKTNIEKCKSPYIPNNFKYIEGKWNTGYVIEDEKENQFVWVPCTTQTNEYDIPILEKTNFVSSPNITHFLTHEDEEDCKQFLNSCLENGGFYISRFEIGKDENKNPVSKKGVKIWTDITKKEAKEKSESMEKSINSKLINGYAYDVVLNFISNDVDKYSETKNVTGTKSIKNIYDILDNMYEITSEMQFDSMVYRGVIDYDKVNLDTRLVSNIDFIDSNLTFRTIIYK